MDSSWICLMSVFWLCLTNKNHFAPSAREENQELTQGSSVLNCVGLVSFDLVASVAYEEGKLLCEIAYV